MTKAELIEVLAAAGMVSKAAVSTILDKLAEEVRKDLAYGNTVTIPGIVKLTPKQRAARKSRNPRTGETVDVPAKRVVSAKPVKALADHIA